MVVSMAAPMVAPIAGCRRRCPPCRRCGSWRVCGGCIQATTMPVRRHKRHRRHRRRRHGHPASLHRLHHVHHHHGLHLLHLGGCPHRHGHAWHAWHASTENHHGCRRRHHRMWCWTCSGCSTSSSIGYRCGAAGTGGSEGGCLSSVCSRCKHDVRGRGCSGVVRSRRRRSASSNRSRLCHRVVASSPCS